MLPRWHVLNDLLINVSYMRHTCTYNCVDMCGYVSHFNNSCSDVNMMYFVKWYCTNKICILHCKYSRYLHKINTMLFTILSTTTCHLPDTIIGKVGLLPYDIIFSADAPSSVHQPKNRWNSPKISTSRIMVIKRWNFSFLMIKGMVNAIMVILWRYLKYLQCRTNLSLEQNRSAYYRKADWLKKSNTRVTANDDVTQHKYLLTRQFCRKIPHIHLTNLSNQVPFFTFLSRWVF